jgi:hypothetical protein
MGRRLLLDVGMQCLVVGAQMRFGAGNRESQMKQLVLCIALGAILTGCASTASVPSYLVERYRGYDCDELDSLMKRPSDDTIAEAVRRARLSKSCDAPDALVTF